MAAPLRNQGTYLHYEKHAYSNKLKILPPKKNEKELSEDNAARQKGLIG